MKRIILSFMALIFAVSSFAQSTVETINSPKAMKPIIMVIRLRCGSPWIAHQAC